MIRYRTEVIVPDDRYIHLKLPADAPSGRAYVVVEFDSPGKPDDRHERLDREIEWWDEFDSDQPNMDK